MGSNGFIVLHRRFLDWEWYQDHNVSRLFLHLLLRANHQPKKWEGVTIGRGQVLSGRIKLSKETGLSQQSIRTALNKLVNTGNLTIKSTNKNSIYTICNYDKWQSGNIANQQTNQRSTSNQPAINQQSTTNNNDNNDNNDNNSICENEIPLEIPKDWRDIFSLWLEYKKEKKQKYKSQKTILTAYRHLIDLSSNNLNVAEKIVQQSIANNWSGLFELKGNLKQDNSADAVARRVIEKMKRREDNGY